MMTDPAFTEAAGLTMIFLAFLALMGGMMYGQIVDGGNADE